MRSLPLFSAFDDSQIAVLNEAADYARIGPGETLYRPGIRLDSLIILLAGFVAETHPHRGEEIPTDVTGPVSPIGFEAAMLDAETESGATTITSIRLVLVPVTVLQGMIGADPRLGAAFLQHALHSLRDLARERRRLKLQSSVQRLGAWLLDQAEPPDQRLAQGSTQFSLPYEKRFLAAKIGCSQVNLSRAFSLLRRLGVETRRDTVTLNDIPVLREFVESPAHATEAA